jgi:hypothetical protein
MHLYPVAGGKRRCRFQVMLRRCRKCRKLFAGQKAIILNGIKISQALSVSLGVQFPNAKQALTLILLYKKQRRLSTVICKKAILAARGKCRQACRVQSANVQALAFGKRAKLR